MHHMKITKEMREMMEHHYNKMYLKRMYLFKAFVINYVAIFAAWLLSLTGLFHWMVAHVAPVLANPMAADMYMLWMIGGWKVLAAVFYLVPAIATWWNMSCIEKHLK